MRSEAKRRSRRGTVLVAAFCALAPLPLTAQQDPASRAAATERQMTDDERIALTLGHLTSAMPGRPAPPPEARPGAGYIPGVPRLGVPEPTVLPLERFAEGLELYRSRQALKIVLTP